jgi:hypothetical protein
MSKWLQNKTLLLLLLILNSNDYESMAKVLILPASRQTACRFNPHNEVLIRNPGLSNEGWGPSFLMGTVVIIYIINRKTSETLRPFGYNKLRCLPLAYGR